MTQQSFRTLAISRSDDLIYGRATKPVRCGRGLTIGAGLVYPEINFTLPPLEVTKENWPDIRHQYTAIIDGVCKRAIELEAPGLVVEFELLPPMTAHPGWGAEITAILRRRLDEAHAEAGLPNALRVTPTDIRDSIRPVRQRSGPYWAAMRESFASCAQAGADLLSIESTGGKEIHDAALMQCDLAAVTIAHGIFCARDMAFLWDAIGEACRGTSCLPAGDTACGFANTAMVLADRKMIPRVFAAIVRVLAAVRSLVAYEHGAVGPSKDCAYEGPYLKAITGMPIAMEGKSAACAHLSHLGNIAAATADLWSNESVQNVRLLGGDAPVVSVEQLIYDCRLFNEAAADGPDAARRLRDWMVRSDASRDPQAYILTPDNVIRIAQAIVSREGTYGRCRAAASETLALLREGYEGGKLKLSDREAHWLDMLDMQMESLPPDEAAALASFDAAAYPDLIPAEYGA